MVAIMKIRCKIFGHTWNGIITGVTAKGNPIGRCKRCEEPVVDEGQEVAPYMGDCYKVGKYVAHYLEETNSQAMEITREKVFKIVK